MAHEVDYDARIRVSYRADPELERAIEAHREWIAGETLSRELTTRDGDADELESASVEDMEFAFRIQQID